MKTNTQGISRALIFARKSAFFILCLGLPLILPSLQIQLETLDRTYCMTYQKMVWIINQRGFQKILEDMNLYSSVCPDIYFSYLSWFEL